MNYILKSAVLSALTLTATQAAAAPKAEVLHWWTSGGEAKAVAVLQQEFTARNGTWTDMPVAGGGGDAAMTALRARVLAGNAPTAVQLKGPAIQEWFEEGVLADISPVAEAQGWDKVLPEAIANHMKCDGNWCAAPVNVHRVDYLWGNAEVLAKHGIAMPSSWEEFNASAAKLKAAGVIPLAHGGQSWQDATLFETVVLGLGGPEFYRDALVDLKPEALGSDTMKQIFDQMRVMRGFVDDNFSGRDWNLSTAMVMNGEAGFQLMGDWAKGEFLAAGKVPGKDFLCAPAPSKGYLYNVDSFAMFEVKGDDNKEGQALLAELIVAPAFQETFNLYKGSIPVRNDIDMGKFDACALDSAKAMNETAAAGTLLPSFAHGMALPGLQAGAITDVITAHFNSDMSSEEAVQRLVAALAAIQ